LSLEWKSEEVMDGESGDTKLAGRHKGKTQNVPSANNGRTYCLQTKWQCIAMKWHV